MRMGWDGAGRVIDSIDIFVLCICLLVSIRCMQAKLALLEVRAQRAFFSRAVLFLTVRPDGCDKTGRLTLLVYCGCAETHSVLSIVLQKL